MRGNAEGRDRRGIVNVARETKRFLGRIVMIAQKIVRLHYLDIVNLGRLQNFARAFRAGDVGARAHLAPAPKRAAHANLRPDADDQRHADIKQPMTPAISDWVEHSRLKCVCLLDADKIASLILLLSSLVILSEARNLS